MKGKKNAVEWSVFVVSLILVGATVALLIADAFRGRTEPPDVKVQFGTPIQRSSGWAVPMVIRNEGDETGENVHVEVALQRDGRDVEVAEVTIAFLPRKSRREAWALFREDPRGYSVVARAVGFERP